MSHPHRRCGARTGLSGVCLITLLGATGIAQAAVVFDKDNGQVELYDILDVGLGYLEHSYSASDVLASTVNSYNLNSSPHSFTGLYSGGVSMSRFGVRHRPALPVLTQEPPSVESCPR
jgi:hypothetical protein